MIAVIDYGAGNLHSVQKAVEHVGGNSVVTNDARVILRAEKVILPGVGAFKDGMQGLRERELIEVIKEAVESGKHLLGICLGMQLLFDESDEQGWTRGLSLLPGKVIPFQKPGIKIPQIGWNQLTLEKSSPILTGIETGEYAYFNHSYYCDLEGRDPLIASTDYGVTFASVVGHENVFGVQFHPEKSQRVGQIILKNFVELAYA